VKNNYLIPFLMCTSGTVMTALGQNINWQWLAVSDINVGIFLVIAWLLDPHRPR